MNKLSDKYWDELYATNQIGWDVGYATKPISDYIDQLSDKNISILIPGAGNAYEAEYLLNEGFTNIYILDFAKKVIKNFKNRVPYFPDNKIIKEDFFLHQGKYDLIFEQTFFSSIIKSDREKFVEKIHQLLLPGGKYVGILFNHEFGSKNPPFGGTKKDYVRLFGRSFNIKTFEIAENSIKPRKGRELFFIMEKN